MYETMKPLLPLVTFILLPLGVFLLTKNPITGSYSLQMTLVVLIILCIYLFTLKRKGEPILHNKGFIYLVTTFILFLVAATGWFFSPFFFLLYLLGIALAFVFPLRSSAGFIITLVLLFSFNVGEVDLTYDFLIILSLLSTIPLSLFLRKEYLRLKEAENEIMVLEKEKEKAKTVVEEILANKISHFGMEIRQPINDVKQIGYHLQKNPNEKDKKQFVENMLVSAEDALRILKGFEEEVTGKKLLSTPIKKNT